MDLKHEFEAIIQRYGHSVFLQRRVEDTEAGPYREINGGRYQTTAEKWTSYRWFPETRRKVKDSNSAPEGLIGEIDAIFYLQASATPKMGDLISEPTPHERIKRFTYRVERSVPYYIGNILTYFAAHCKRIEPDS